MKKFLLGLLVGIIISTSTIALARTIITAELVNFRFMVNGREQTIDTPSFAFSGRSYLPVRSLATMLGYNVDYLAETKTIILTSTATPPIATEPPSNVAPQVTTIGKWFFNGEEYTSPIELPVFINGVLHLQIRSFMELIGVRDFASTPTVTGWTASFKYPPNYQVQPRVEVHLSNAGFNVNGKVRFPIPLHSGRAIIPLKDAVELLGGSFLQSAVGNIGEVQVFLPQAARLSERPSPLGGGWKHVVQLPDGRKYLLYRQTDSTAADIEASRRNIYPHRILLDGLLQLLTDPNRHLTDGALPGGLSGTIENLRVLASNTGGILTSKKHYYNVKDINSDYYIVFNYTFRGNTLTIDSRDIPRARHDSGCLYPLSLDEINRALGLNLIYSIDTEARVITYRFRP